MTDIYYMDISILLMNRFDYFSNFHAYNDILGKCLDRKLFYSQHDNASVYKAKKKKKKID